MKAKSILVSQPGPKTGNSPYSRIIENHSVEVGFVPLIKVEGMTVKDTRTQETDPTRLSVIILTSHKSVDHYFRITEEMRFKVPDTMKYFCQSEAIIFYLQRYITCRKRKIHVDKKELSESLPILKKYKSENFLPPGFDSPKPKAIAALNDLKIRWGCVVPYRTVCCDISTAKNSKYDILIFFSPVGIEALFESFPDFSQKRTKIAVYGDTALKAVEEAGFVIDIKASSPKSPLIIVTLDRHIGEMNGKK